MILLKEEQLQKLVKKNGSRIARLELKVNMLSNLVGLPEKVPVAEAP